MRQSSAQPDLIPATTSDGFLLALESLMRSHGQGCHLSATVIELDGQPDTEALTSAARCLSLRHPLLNARLKRRGDFLCYWHPSAPNPVPLQIHPAGDIDTVISVFLRESSIDILADGPNLELHVLPTGEHSWALILIWPHALFDAIGIDKLISELDDPSEDPRQEWGETSKTVGGVSELWKQAKPIVEEFRTFPEWRIRSLYQKQKAGPPRYEVIRFSREESTLIREKMAQTAGELLLLPYFATCAARAAFSIIRQRHKTEQGTMLLSLPVQRVASPKRRPLFQNHMTAYSLLMQPEELEDLTSATHTLYKKYADFMRRKLPAAMDAMMKLMDRCPSHLYLKPAFLYQKGEICSLFHSHTGHFAKGVEKLAGSVIRNGYHVPTVSSPPGLGIFFSEFDARLTCTISWREGNLNGDEYAMLRKNLLSDLTDCPQSD